ncbi:MAG: PHP domain-containing protein, partial [Candidatus Paceibacteria bacterium]
MKTPVIKTVLVETKDRVDAIVAAAMSLSRKEAKAVIEAGFCEVGGKVVKKASLQPQIGSELAIREFDGLFEKSPIQSSAIPKIVFEDSDIIVLSKPSGLTVHEGSGTTESTLVDYLRQNDFTLFEADDRARDGIVHRLDRETSGLMVLEKNKVGYQNLIQLVTKSHLEGFYYKPRIDKELLKKYSNGLIAMSSCLHGEIPQTILAGNIQKAKKIALEYQDIFGRSNFYLELMPHYNLEGQKKVNNALREISESTGIPLVATNDVHYIY